MKKILSFMFLFVFFANSIYAQDNPETTQPEKINESEAAGKTESVKPKSFFIGFELGAGFVQTMIPDEFTQSAYLGAFEAESKTGFAFDIGLTLSWYFTKYIGLHFGFGYDYNPFHMKGKANDTIAGVSGQAGNPFPGYSGYTVPSYEVWADGYLKGKIHYLFIRIGPSLKISNFFFHLDAALVINLSATYEFKAESSAGNLSKVGDYDEAQAIAFGLIFQPGWRFDLGGIYLPVSLEFRIFLTPIGETDISGIQLPEATIKTWSLKIRVGMEF